MCSPWAFYPISWPPALVFARVVTDILATLRDYYRQPPVRARMLEFLGADEAGDFTAEYITADTTDAA